MSSRKVPSLLDLLCAQIEKFSGLTVAEVAEMLNLSEEVVRDRLDERAEERGMPDGPFFDREMQRITWAELVVLDCHGRPARPGQAPYRQIARRWLPRGFVASTVWTGSACVDENPPAIFETLIHHPRGSESDPIGPWRWLNEECARWGHLQCLAAFHDLAPWPVDYRDLAEFAPEWAQAMVSPDRDVREWALQERQEISEAYVTAARAPEPDNTEDEQGD